MENRTQFETGILKVIAIIGFVRYVIAFTTSRPEVDGSPDFYLDIITASVFLAGLILVYKNAGSNRIV